MGLGGEYHPQPESNTGVRALHRFDADIVYTDSRFDHFFALVVYIGAQFTVDDDVARKIIEEKEGLLPGRDLYESSPREAKEQMRLALLRLVLPIYEDLNVDKDGYCDQVERLVSVSLGGRSRQGSQLHDPDACLGFLPRNRTHGCKQSANCPVKVAYSLCVEPIERPDFNQPIYNLDWIDTTEAKLLARLEAARAAGVVTTEYSEPLGSAYRQLVSMRKQRQLS